MEMINPTPIIWREFRVQVFNLSKAVGNFVVPSFALLFFAVAIGANFPPIRYNGESFNYAAFFLPGLIGIQAFMMMNYGYASVRQDRVSRIVCVIATSRTSMVDYMLGKLCGCVVLVLVRSAILIGVTALLVGIPLFGGLRAALTFVVILMISTIFWYATGFALGTFVLQESLGSLVFGIGGTLLTFASTAYYNVQRAPAWVRSIAAVNPLSYSCNSLRSLLLQGTAEGQQFDLLLVAGLAVVALAAACAAAGRVVRTA